MSDATRESQPPLSTHNKHCNYCQLRHWALLQLAFQVIMNDNSPPASELSVSDDYSHYSNEYGTEASARSTLADLLERFARSSDAAGS